MNKVIRLKAGMLDREITIEKRSKVSLRYVIVVLQPPFPT